MAKRKDFSSKGMGQKIGLGKNEPETIRENPAPKKRPISRERTTKAGEIRYTVLVEQELLANVKRVSSETGRPIKKLFDTALRRYLEEVWNEEALQEYKAKFGDTD